MAQSPTDYPWRRIRMFEPGYRFALRLQQLNGADGVLALRPAAFIDLGPKADGPLTAKCGRRGGKRLLSALIGRSRQIGVDLRADVR